MADQQAESPLNDRFRAQLDALEKLLQVQIEDHERLDDCLGRKMDAVRKAEISRVIDVVKEERAIVERLSQVEQHRQELVRQISKRLKGEAAAMSMHDIVEAADGSIQQRLRDAAGRLRELVERVREQSAIVRTAAEALARHLGGIMQHLHAALSQAGVYGSRGRIATGARVEYSIDLKT